MVVPQAAFQNARLQEDVFKYSQEGFVSGDQPAIKRVDVMSVLRLAQDRHVRCEYELFRDRQRAFSGGRPTGFVDQLADAFRTGVGPDYDAQGEQGAHEVERMSASWSRHARCAGFRCGSTVAENSIRALPPVSTATANVTAAGENETHSSGLSP